MQSIVYVGIDVHKDTYSLCALDPMNGEIIGETKCAAQDKLIERFLNGLINKRGAGTQFVVGYEAGCLGYSLYNQLSDRGIECIILAPSTMYSDAKHKMVKNDKLDARMIASNLANKTYNPVYVPDKEDVEVKEYLRMRKTFKKALKRVKQQLLALILRLGFRFDGTKTNWTHEHYRWIKALPVSKAYQEIISEELIEIQDLEVKIERYDTRIEEFAQQERYKTMIQQLKCFKGVSTNIAMTIHIETSDFSRFPNARAYMAYLGLTPSEHSSGKHTDKGALTKQGNSTIRSALIEAAQALIKGHAWQKSKVLLARQKGQPAEVISYADRATKRLEKKYHHLIEKIGKQKNIAVAAVARELAGFIWGMETNHTQPRIFE